MDRLRRIAPLLAALLALVVGAEVTDALPCADTDCGVWNALLHPDAPPLDGGDHDPAAACLCQGAFVSTAVLPADLSPAPTAGALGWVDPPPLPSPTGRVPHPPPRG